MSRINGITQIYGYAACLTALIFMIVNIPNIIKTSSDLADPLKSEGSPRVLRQSYEEWKIDYIKYYIVSTHDVAGTKESIIPPLPDDHTLRDIYDQTINREKESLLLKVKIKFWENIAYVFLSLIVFILHWFWMRKYATVQQSTQ